jgi:tetratricopeptide (TPR) repeat protein
MREHLSARFADAEQDPRSADAVGRLCVAYHADLLYEQAQRCYEQVSQLGASEWRLPYFRAILESDRGGGEAVANSLRQVIAQAADFSPAWLRLGDAEFKGGHYDRAEAAWTRAVDVSEPARPTNEPPQYKVEIPVSSYASLGLARIALARGDPGQARHILERVTSQSPRFGPSFRLLAESYTALGRMADAERAMHSANRLPPYAPYLDPAVEELVRESRSSTFLLRQASDADLASNAEWSEFLTRRALTFDPENPEVVAKLGRLLRTLGRSAEALEFLDRYTRMVPGDFQGIGQLGSCLSDLGRFEQAEPFIRQALAGLDDALSHYNLGALLSATGRFDEAVIEYRRALDRDPADSDARSNLAAVLLRQGKLGPASQELSRVLALDPENANAHTNFGLLLAHQGQMARAAEEFRTALRLNPRQRQAADALRELGR